MRVSTRVGCVHARLALSARLTRAYTSRYLGNNPLLAGAVPTWLGSFANLEVLYVGIGEPLVCLLTSARRVWQGHAIHRHVGDFAARAGVARFLGCAHHLEHNDDRRIHPNGTRQHVQCYYSVRMSETRTMLGGPHWLTECAVSDLSGNSLAGGLPAQLGNLTSLESLDLSDNAMLSGSIPVELAKLTKLTHLNLCSCSLTGSIPDELADLGPSGGGVTL